jgi:murein DD-endopeptidase MepM/ murein hydrolase activator NlpD
MKVIAVRSSSQRRIRPLGAHSRFGERIADGRLYTGDGTRNEDYVAFGAEVHAVADGTVVFVRDGRAEDTPNEPPTTLQGPIDYGGNEVFLEIAPGVYAFYAHFQPGSIRVQAGEAVTAGQVLGLLGNTGNSSAPHLHFALLDGPDGLAANSLPFAIDAWTLEGMPGPESSATDVRLEGETGVQHETLPLDMTVAAFP